MNVLFLLPTVLILALPIIFVMGAAGLVIDLLPSYQRKQKQKKKLEL
jgi:putative effector of murein hydrolase LrgA (UPF0299 family)